MKKTALIIIFMIALTGCVKNSINEKYIIGDGDDDSWIDYPSWHPKAGEKVEHPSWVLKEIEKKPLVILVHSNNCLPCIQQQKDLEDLLENFGNDIIYVDITADGSDSRAWDAYNIYYPLEGQWYIPLTIIISKLEYKGESCIIWHSEVGRTGKDWLTKYINNSISYYGAKI
ncbi:MAG: thioredoxin family protein [Thermoplasmatales archaeon]|nr:thioredoxin family protein [Thermoplasmatales archaeon]